ncbi:hypothetical protein ACIQUQ_27760 [Streptomyces sp. NPDC101118]|uniref:hypothetical protein n=1 Tax=Streptomyces sp. NPDC101118 TaxID=3366109 RepID=UPI003802F45C
MGEYDSARPQPGTDEAGEAGESQDNVQHADLTVPPAAAAATGEGEGAVVPADTGSDWIGPSAAAGDAAEGWDGPSVAPGDAADEFIGPGAVAEGVATDWIGPGLVPEAPLDDAGGAQPG